MSTAVSATYLDTMVEAYLTAAEWTAPDENGMERDLPGGEFRPTAGRDTKTVADARKDCADFVTEAGPLLSEWTADQAGHDFWLTRNGHGTGFWDRGLGAVGDVLTDIAQSFGSEDAYVDTAQGNLLVLIGG